PAAGAAIGLAVGIGALFAGPLTGGSMNPARTLGPALIAGTWSHAWIYLVGPILGAVGAMGLYELVRDGSTPEPGAAHRAKAARTQLEVRP
ncbi:MAG: aquaporin, partial [Candidatus Thermoplasmatota archaeon]|nr:aquaporin [Candidatus Thermoplasmatota archaeon]